MTMFQASQIVYVYNQRRYVDEVVAAAYAQDYDGEMEILLSDDGSTDGSYERLLELAASYTGRHHVRVRRTPVNKGAAYHLDQAVRECRGELIVGIAGDDIPLPHRVSSMVRHWQDLGGGTVLIYSDIEMIDIDGNTVVKDSWTRTENHDLESIAAGRIGILGASTAFTRNLIEGFPGFNPRLLNEDRVTPWRALLLGGQVSYLDLKTVKYRIAGGVSRNFPKDLKGYLRSWSLKKHEAYLEDAKQRIDDMRHAGFENPAIYRACRRTIAMHRTVVALARSHWSLFEVHLLKGLVSGSEKRFTLSHYAKFRARWILQRFLNPRIRATVDRLN